MHKTYRLPQKHTLNLVFDLTKQKYTVVFSLDNGYFQVLRVEACDGFTSMLSADMHKAMYKRQGVTSNHVASFDSLYDANRWIGLMNEDQHVGNTHIEKVGMAQTWQNPEAQVEYVIERDGEELLVTTHGTYAQTVFEQFLNPAFPEVGKEFTGNLLIRFRVLESETYKERVLDSEMLVEYYQN